jgi:hypothetical protein
MERRKNMAKGKGVLMTAFLAGVTAYLSKKENRDKTVRMIKNMRSTFSKETDFGEKRYSKTNNNDLREIAETAADDTETKIRENNMIAESGLQTAVIYYNENNQEVQ